MSNIHTKTKCIAVSGKEHQLLISKRQDIHVLNLSCFFHAAAFHIPGQLNEHWT